MKQTLPVDIRAHLSLRCCAGNVKENLPKRVKMVSIVVQGQYGREKKMGKGALAGTPYCTSTYIVLPLISPCAPGWQPGPSASQPGYAEGSFVTTSLLTERPPSSFPQQWLQLLRQRFVLPSQMKPGCYGNEGAMTKKQTNKTKNHPGEIQREID